MPVTKVDVRPAFNIGQPLVQVTTARGGRRYELPFIEGTPKVPSVTSIISDTIRAVGLEFWRQGWIKTGLQSHLGEVIDDEVIADILGLADAEASRSASVGSELHEILSHLIHAGGSFDIEDELFVSDQLYPAVKAYKKWEETEMKDWEAVSSEEAVWMYERKDMQFAGTVDAIFRNGSNLLLVDFKTSSSTQDSHMLQLAAYKLALVNMLHHQADIHPSSNGKGHAVPFNIEACVLRFVNDLPRDSNHKKDRTQDKIFEEAVEVTKVDDTWVEAFIHLYELNTIRKTNPIR